MADNVPITQGVGTDIATDDVGSVHYQKIKIDAGGDGASTPILAGGGVEASALRVTIANDSTGVVSVDDNGGALTVDGTVAVTNADLSTIAGAVAGTEMQVDVLTMPTVTVNSHAVTNAGTFAVQVDSSTLPTGAATAAKQLADGHNVAVASIAAGTNLIGKVSIDQVTANANEVVVKSGSITADLGANNDVTVTGTVDLGATDNAVLDEIAAYATAAASSAISIDGKMTACNTGAVVISSGSCTVDLGENNDVTVSGTVNVTSADIEAIKTAVEIIDDWDSSDACKVTFIASTASIGQFQPSKYPTTDDPEYMNKYTFSTGAASDVIVWSPAAGKRWYVTDLIISTSAAAVVTLEDDRTTGDTAVLTLDLAANGGTVCNFKTPLASGEDAADLIVTTSAGNIYITATGYEV
jgi:hypothetical protein